MKGSVLLRSGKENKKMASTVSVNLSVKKPRSGSSSGSKPRKKSFKISKTILSLIPSNGNGKNNAVSAGGGGGQDGEQNNNELPAVPEDGDASSEVKIRHKSSKHTTSSQTSAKLHSRKKKRSLRRRSSIEWVLPEFIEPSRRGGRRDQGTGDYVTSETDRNSSVLEPSPEMERLEQDNHQLQLQVYNLQRTIADLKAKGHRHLNRNVVAARMNILQKENQNLKDDAEVLKSVIRRLNKEIRFYQEKLRSKYKSSHRIPVYSTSNSTNEEEEEEEDDILLKEPRSKMQPLLIAYDEIISDKDELIKDYEVALGSFRDKVQEIVKENEALHRTIAEGREKGSVSQEEWQILYSNALMVLEGNDLLRDQVAVLKRKAALMQKKQEEKESKLQLKISLLEEERLKMKLVNTQLDTHCKNLAEQVAKLTESLQNRIPAEQYEASVWECKRLFEELKGNYAEDRKNLTEKLTAVEAEKHRLVVEVTDLGTENAKLQGTIKDLENSLANNHKKLKEMYAKMEEASRAKEATTKTVAEMMELAKAVVQDRETLEKSLEEQKNLNVKMMNIRSQESELVRELREKIRVMEEEHKSEVQKLLQRTRELEKILDGIGERQQNDVSQLKELLQEKSQRIELLMAEKSQLAQDLETVWRATTSAKK